MLRPNIQDVVRFGDFELDVRAYELRRNGCPVKLERRPMDLLIFLVERRGELVTRTDIVDQLWGRDVFIEVEPAVNTVIKKIRRALEDSSDTPAFVETIPRKGYRFVAAVTNRSDSRDVAPAAAVDAPSPTKDSASVLAPPIAAVSGRRAAALTLGACALLFAVIAAGWQRLFPPEDATGGGPLQLVALTTLTGDERGPTFSPDGRQVAFTWSGEARDNWDIYVKLVGSPEARRLTTHPTRDLTPRWSFDGRHIAYLRAEPSGEVERLRVMSALGGSDRQLSELAVLPAPGWSPDDQWIAAGLLPGQTGRPGGVYLLPVEGGQPRQLTQSPVGGVDWMPAFSPDGRHLAYGSCRDFTSNCHMHVLTLDAAFGAVGPPRRLTVEPIQSIRGVAWARNGLSVIFGVIQGARNELWRVSIDGGASPRRIEIAAANALFPATAHSADRLAFTRGIVDEDVYAMEVGRLTRSVARSSVFDGYAQFSPDNQRVAFCSDRAGSTEIWIADADGSHAEQLTRGPGQWQCSPTWSRDGRSVAFESRDATGDSQIFSIDVELRQPRQLTSGPGDRKLPSWSRNGEWIYFSWNQGESRDIWRVPRHGGAPERVTTTGSGLAGVESADGTTLFYLGHRTTRIHDPTDAPLLAQSLAGGEARDVIACVMGTAFSVGEHGIYYLPCRSAPADKGDPLVFVLDLANGRRRSLGTLDGYENKVPSGFSASSDGRTFLYSRLISRGEDLMLIENFK